jgi:hypothetical protein
VSTKISPKLNQIFTLQKTGVPLLSSWLEQQGYSHDLQQRYKKSKWLVPISTGVFVRIGDTASLEGAICALQQQCHLSIHPTDAKALELPANKLILFGSLNEKLPPWFANYDWGIKIDYHRSGFLDPRTGLVNTEIRGVDIVVSDPARALMERLYLAPQHQDLMECYDAMEKLGDLQPEYVQTLLESCHSIKVNRLFEYMADKAGHEWLDYINTENIDLGKGKLSIVKNGVYVDGYNISVPKELDQRGRLLF